MYSYLCTCFVENVTFIYFLIETLSVLVRPSFGLEARELLRFYRAAVPQNKILRWSRVLGLVLLGKISGTCAEDPHPCALFLALCSVNGIIL